MRLKHILPLLLLSVMALSACDNHRHYRRSRISVPNTHSRIRTFGVPRRRKPIPIYDNYPDDDRREAYLTNPSTTSLWVPRKRGNAITRLRRERAERRSVTGKRSKFRRFR
jgi:hypothetical protein